MMTVLEIEEYKTGYRAILEDTDGERYWIEFFDLEEITALSKGLLEKIRGNECEWKLDPDGFYATACGGAFGCFDDGGLAENDHIFCSKCGKRIKEVGK